MTDLSLLTAADFQHLADREFARAVREGEPPVSLTLVEVREGRHPLVGRHPFALFFTGPPHLLLAQGGHPLRHPVLGEFELFLVPIGKDADAARYEAVFG
jgi:hypothetical protein